MCHWDIVIIKQLAQTYLLSDKHKGNAAGEMAWRNTMYSSKTAIIKCLIYARPYDGHCDTTPQSLPSFKGLIREK